MPITSLPTYATGDTIEAITPNTLRDNVSLLDGRTGGDPGSSSRVLGAISAVGGQWLTQLFANFVDNQALGTDVVDQRVLGPSSVGSTELRAGAAVANIGYQPVNRGGDSAITGGLGMTISAGTGQPLVGLTIQNASAGASSALVKFIAGGLASFIGAINGVSSFVVLDPPGTTVLFGLNAAGQLEVGGQTVWNRGNDGAGSGLDADLLDGRNTGTGSGNIAFYDANGRVFAAGFADAAGDANTLDGHDTGTASGNIAFYDGTGRVVAAITATNFSGSLAGDVTGTQGATVVPNKLPTGAIVMFRSGSEVPATGWLGEANLAGRFPIGVGTTFSQTFAENTNYGASWTPTAGLGATNNVSATSTGTGGASTSDHTAAAGAGVPGASHTHGAPTITIGGTVDITGAGGVYIPPCRAYVFARKT